MNNVILKDGDFVWVYNGYENTIEWGLIQNNKIIYQTGGFDDLDDYDNYLVNNIDINYHIGGIVRYATSFVSARAYYDWFIMGEDRFIDHNTTMCAIAIGEDFIQEKDKEVYIEHMNNPIYFDINTLETMFGRDVCITHSYSY